MVIGISGRLGSGKDTVGKLIQYMTAEDVGAGCLGRIRGGLSIDGHHNSSFENKKFAGKLKLIGSILSGAPVEMFEDQDFKKLPMTENWNVWQVSDSSSRIEPFRFTSEEAAKKFLDMQLVSLPYLDLKIARVEMTYREFLQKLGTEGMRDGLHTNVWINALFADYKRKLELVKSDSPKYDLKVEESGEYPNWIITDMRFPNEMESVKDKGGITIRVIRPVHALSQENNATQLHPSETALDNAEFDYVIENDGSFDDLILKVENILKKEQIPYKRWSI